MAGIISTPVSYIVMWTLAPVKARLFYVWWPSATQLETRLALKDLFCCQLSDRFLVWTSEHCLGEEPHCFRLESIHDRYFAIVQSSFKVSWIFMEQRKIPPQRFKLHASKGSFYPCGHVRVFSEKAWCSSLPLQPRQIKAPLDMH